MLQPVPMFCPNCGSELEMAEAAGRQRPVCTECGFVYYQNPIPAVGMLIEMDNGVVLIKRGHPPHPGRWALPSGFVEADESVEEAAIREAKEETGLDIKLMDMLGVFSFPDGPPTSGIIVFYRARPIGGKLGGGDDAEEARVFQSDDIPEFPFRTHRQAIARWRVHHRARQQDIRRVERDGFFIREAGLADTGRMLELVALIDGAVSAERAQLRAATQRFREDPSLIVFVAETYDTDPQVIGVVTLSRVSTLTGLVGWIDAMVVDPQFRRIGVGAALLEATMRRAQHIGMTEMYVNTDRGSEIARAFYHASGFQDGRITRLRLSR
jgi:8-oxo-dGTP diphosphatase